MKTFRDVEFRGRYQGITGEVYWFYGHLAKQDNGLWEITDGNQLTATVDNVGQFAGVPDKNGKKLFEGDIISTPIADMIGVIEFDKGLFGVNFDYGTDKKTMLGSWGTETNLRHLHDGFYRKIEVIGNIHENPELLK